MRNPTVDEGVVTFSVYRRAGPSTGTPFGDVLWAARQLLAQPPTAAELGAPLYPGAMLDVDGTTSSIINEPSPVISYFTSNSVESVRAYYGVPADTHTRKISPDNRLHGVTVEAYSKRDSEKRTRISITLPYEGPSAYLTGSGPAVPGAPPGWKPRQWKGGCVREPIGIPDL